MQASEEVWDLARRRPRSHVNLYGVGGNCLAVTVQVDWTVHVVGQDDFTVGHYTLSQWLDDDDLEDTTFTACESAADALDLFDLLCEDTRLWQCRECEGWVRTTGRPRLGFLRCSTCGRGGVHFVEEDRAPFPAP